MHAFPPRRWPAARTHEDVARRVLDLELVGPRLAHLCWPPGRLLELGPHHLEGHKAPLLLRRRRRGAVGRRQPAPLRHRLHRAELCKQPGERSQAQRTASVTRVATASHQHPLARTLRLSRAAARPQPLRAHLAAALGGRCAQKFGVHPPAPSYAPPPRRRAAAPMVTDDQPRGFIAWQPGKLGWQYSKRGLEYCVKYWRIVVVLSIALSIG